MRRALLFCTLIALLHSCRTLSGGLKVLERNRLDSLPSGSALLLRNDTVYIIGDDATGLYRFRVGKAPEKLPVARLDAGVFREAKGVKHDFEASVILEGAGGPQLMAFGSGSNAVRDSALLCPLSGGGAVFALKGIYTRMKNGASIPQGGWNIEGAAVAVDTLYLFNRGDNSVFSFPLDGFMRHLRDNSAAFPAMRKATLQLPSINGKPARVSGACTYDDTHLLFTASVEDTHNWTTDGEVHGSFIGVYELRTGTVLHTWPLPAAKGAAPAKLESLDVLRRHADGSCEVLAVADNDDGASTLFRIRIPKF